MADNRFTDGGEENQDPPIEVFRNINWTEWHRAELLLSDASMLENPRGAADKLFNCAVRYCRVLKTTDPRIFQGAGPAKRFANDSRLWKKAFFEFEPGHRVSVAALIAKPSLWPDDTGLVCKWRTLGVGEGFYALYRIGREKAIFRIESIELHLGRPLITSGEELSKVGLEIGCMSFNQELWPAAFRDIVVEHTVGEETPTSFEEANRVLADQAAENPMQLPALVVEGGVPNQCDGVFLLEDTNDWTEIVDIHLKLMPTLIQNCLDQLEGLDDDKYRAFTVMETFDRICPCLYAVDTGVYAARPWKNYRDSRRQQ